MAPVPNGVYVIRFNTHQITLRKPTDPAVLVPGSEDPGLQEWQVEGLADGNVTIKNVRHGTYLTYDSDPRIDKMILGSTEPRSWALRQAGFPGTCHVVAPGGPVEGSELALDVSQLRFSPQQLALRPLKVDDLQQAWGFMPTM